MDTYKLPVGYTLWLHSVDGTDPPNSHHYRQFGETWHESLRKAGYEPHVWPDAIPYTYENVLWLRMAVREKARVLAKIRDDFAKLRAEIASRPIDSPTPPRDPYASIEWTNP